MLLPKVAVKHRHVKNGGFSTRAGATGATGAESKSITGALLNPVKSAFNIYQL